ncbi:MAG TPA: formate--tetrahydrofolate ligase [Trueperaceae bacterium]|nr:formate--tetrahydrofolate ligase [Trueperaceae bacterium]
MDTPLRPILDVASELGVDAAAVTPLGTTKAKIDRRTGARRPQGKLVLVSAIGPTAAGEGKTTVSIGLADGLRRIGARGVAALREPSLGPLFGIKGGGTGGGRSTLQPAHDINLHFTGDMHAITSAHNLVAAMIDSDLHFGAASGLDAGRVTWPRVLDVDDRALRSVVVAAGKRGERGTRFDITAASEVMAIMALATDLEDLRTRLDRTVVGWRRDGATVTIGDLGAVDAMLALLRDALDPNLAQTAEGAPALVHTGPFGNIAHGCSSVIATELALRHADVVVTEAGFGFDLGGEKFLHLKARQAGLWPRLVVLVATVRALAAHGDGDLARGLAHLDRQIANVRAFGLPAVVALNVFDGDSETDLAAVEARAERLGTAAARITAFADGGRGGEALATRVLEAIAATDTDPPAPRYLYEPTTPFREKVGTLGRRLYGAAEVTLSDAACRDLAILGAAGLGDLPVCVAKTHLSFSDDPKAGGLASGMTLTVNEVRPAVGAGFLVALMGRINTMPGLPRDPAARRVRVDADGAITGLR